MTKAELVDTLAQQTALTKAQTSALLSAVVVEVGKAIKQDGRFALPNFGTFTVKKRAARKGRNPRTGAAMRIKASKTVGFKPAPALKNGL